MYEARLNVLEIAVWSRALDRGILIPTRWQIQRAGRQINCEKHNSSRLVAIIGPPPLCISMKMIQTLGSPRWWIGLGLVSNIKPRKVPQLAISRVACIQVLVEC